MRLLLLAVCPACGILGWAAHWRLVRNNDDVWLADHGWGRDTNLGADASGAMAWTHPFCDWAKGGNRHAQLANAGGGAHAAAEAGDPAEAGTSATRAAAPVDRLLPLANKSFHHEVCVVCFVAPTSSLVPATCHMPGLCPSLAAAAWPGNIAATGDAVEGGVAKVLDVRPPTRKWREVSLPTPDFQ